MYIRNVEQPLHVHLLIISGNWIIQESLKSDMNFDLA